MRGVFLKIVDTRYLDLTLVQPATAEGESASPLPQKVAWLPLDEELWHRAPGQKLCVVFDDRVDIFRFPLPFNRNLAHPHQSAQPYFRRTLTTPVARHPF